MYVIGAGHIGLTLSAVLADRGFDVVTVEKNETTRTALNHWKPPFHERGLAELLASRRPNIPITLNHGDGR